jgi:hypothetical protein
MVQLLQGGTLALEIESTAITVMELKHAISARIGLQPSFDISFEGRFLPNEHRLEDYNIQKSNTVHMIQRLCG